MPSRLTATCGIKRRPAGRGLLLRVRALPTLGAIAGRMRPSLGLSVWGESPGQWPDDSESLMPEARPPCPRAHIGRARRLWLAPGLQSRGSQDGLRSQQRWSSLCVHVVRNAHARRVLPLHIAQGRKECRGLRSQRLHEQLRPPPLQQARGAEQNGRIRRLRIDLQHDSRGVLRGRPTATRRVPEGTWGPRSACACSGAGGGGRGRALMKSMRRTPDESAQSASVVVCS